jgi:hypothetical protein
MGAQPEGSKGIDSFANLGGLTAIGIFTYAILRFSYWTFYSRFGVTPEEVGLGYIEILTRSAPPLVIFIAIAVTFNGLIAGQRYHMNPKQIWTVVIVTACSVLLAVLIAGLFRANDLANVVERGIPVHPRFVLELIAVQVDYVTVTPPDKTAEQEAAHQAADEKGTAQPQQMLAHPTPQAPSLDLQEPEGIQQRTSLLYFGQSNQIAVLYDHVNQQIIRVPTGDVTIIAE